MKSVTYFIFFLSGVAGLGFEIVWTRMFAVGLGHELPSLLAVLAAYFGGFALGGWCLDRVVSRTSVPGRWYAGMEMLIGVWGFVSIALIPWANDRVVNLIGQTPAFLWHWTIAFVVPFLVLLPATAAMGATLPTMDRFLSRLKNQGRSIGGLYGANTLGAVAGTLASTFLLAPALGFRATILILAGINVLCALAMFFGPARTEAARNTVQYTFDEGPVSFRVGLLIFATGILGIGYEVLGVRVMNQVLENTVYSFASALSMYLLGTSIGAVVYQARAPREKFREVLAFLLVGLAMATMVGIVVLSQADAIYQKLRSVFGGGFGGSVAAEMALAALVFFGPALLMGATFSHLAQTSLRASGGVGRALGLNTLGGSLAPVLFGVVLLPAIGAKLALMLISLGYILLVPRLKSPAMPLAAVSFVMVLLFPINLNLVYPPPGGRLVEYRDGVLAAVAVVNDPRGNRFLKVNNRFVMGGTPSAFGDRRLGHLPLLLHPQPRSAVYLGLGTGITFGAAAAHPDLRAESVELVPEVVDMIAYFEPRLGSDETLKRLSFKVADARRFIRATDKTYDVIVADLFHPARDGAGSLYTLEHFQSVRQRLAPGGVFCQWLPLYQLDLDMLKIIIRTFREVFPETRAYIAHFNASTTAFGLVATAEPTSYPVDWYQRRVQDPNLVKSLGELAIPNGLALFGNLMAGKNELSRFAGDGPINTDDNPRVIFGAPRFTYESDASAYANIKTLIETFRPLPADVIDVGTDADGTFASRLAKYLEARNVYLNGEIMRANRREVEALAAYVETARISPDFRVGYSMAFEMARQRASTDREGALGILRQLEAADPSRPEARQILQSLGDR